MGFSRCGKRVSYKTGLCRYDSFGPKRVGFGCFPTRFARVAAAFAGSWAWGRCACVRGAWEEGRGGDGVGAMGSCQGVFGVWDWRRRGRRAAPLPWVPAFARTTVGGCAGRAGVGGGVRPPGAPLDTGFRRYDDWGVSEVREPETAPHRRPCPGFPLSRERRWGVNGAACRYCVGLPHPAPLDSCLRRNDAKGSVGNGRCWWWRAAAPHLWIPAFAGTTMAGVGDPPRLPRRMGRNVQPVFGHVNADETLLWGCHTSSLRPCLVDAGSLRAPATVRAPRNGGWGDHAEARSADLGQSGLPHPLPYYTRTGFDFPQGERPRVRPSGFLPSQE